MESSRLEKDFFELFVDVEGGERFFCGVEIFAWHFEQADAYGCLWRDHYGERVADFLASPADRGADFRPGRGEYVRDGREFRNGVRGDQGPVLFSDGAGPAGGFGFLDRVPALGVVEEGDGFRGGTGIGDRVDPASIGGLLVDVDLSGDAQGAFGPGAQGDSSFAYQAASMVRGGERRAIDHKA